VLQKLPYSIRAVYLEAIVIAAELFQEAEVVKCRTDKKQLCIELFFCLLALFIGPEKYAMRMVEKKRRAELPQDASRFARELAIWHPRLHILKFRRGRGHRNDESGTAKGYRSLRSAFRETREGKVCQGWSCGRFQKILAAGCHVRSPWELLTGPKVDRCELRRHDVNTAN
jgi:hypothetical protein